ncbi:hypothetical protein HHI36_005346 [Cryptolaemus montrouzieri]|uniref:Neither inactivation nor afterpotential protein C n=1 Tax=Cryptolaemus montrouzieri TaxID=559131 RepID=A0ABD2NTV7_9CUCU
MKIKRLKEWKNRLYQNKTRLTKKSGVRKLQFDDSESESCDESQLCDDDELDDIDADPSHDLDVCIVCVLNILKFRYRRMSGQGAVKLNSFPDPGNRYKLEDVIRVGSFGKTYTAKDTEDSDKVVVVKIQEITPQNEKYLKDEYKLLRDVSSHSNIVDFYGIFSIKNEVMMVSECCEGGSILKLVNDLLSKNRRMKEEHIAHILKEVIKGVSFLHEKHIIHRDLRASNIFLTKGGEVKITGFGVCITLASTFGRSSSAIGSPGWMAPEVIQAKDGDELSYDNRSDVWSLGITAIELGDGTTPFKEMHPTRVLFHVVRNPPPTLYRTSNWSENFNDFIAERRCHLKVTLVVFTPLSEYLLNGKTYKTAFSVFERLLRSREVFSENPEHRPYITELMGHPFIEEIPENNYHLSTELTSLLVSNKNQATQEDIHVVNNTLWEGETRHDEPMYVEDLAALDEIDETTVLSHIERRFNDKINQTFVGEILITLNPNVEENIYTDEYHAKYMMKSKSDNVPHIYSVADSAYQNALHHVLPQKIVLTGESGSGKTKNYLNIVNHLVFIGYNMNIQMSRIQSAIELIHVFTHASTPYNDFSTRCIMKTDISFGSTGKVTGASFGVNLLEKTRISSTDMNQANFNIFYVMYDGLISEKLAEEYKLSTDRQYRYLRILEEERADRPRVEINKNISKFKKIKDIMREFEFSNEEKETIFNCLAAILILGEVRFQDGDDTSAKIVNLDTARMVAQLLDIEERKFCWALTNYCLLKDGAVVSKKNTCDEARDTRDVLANNLYTRLVDYVVAQVNHKLSFGKAIFGEKYLIQIFDYFGFECFKSNELWQLFVNIFNEQMQHYYIQKIFKWEMTDLNEDKIEYEPISYYNNQKLLDTLLGKSDGILNIIGQASKLEYNGKYITEYISNMDTGHISSSNHMEFTVNHYTGKLTYNAKEMPDKNRDFLPPEIIETLRSSNNPLVKLLFTGKLSKTGNLIVEFEDIASSKTSKYMSALTKGTNVNRFSQSKKLRTLAAVFKSVCLETLTELSAGSTSGGIHFVRCIKTNLKANPRTFCKELVKQQIRAMTIPQTAKIRKEGYAYRIQFAEFLRRYQFLAFDFNETVDITPENCRLLLIRLKMEGWIIGKKRVFLKYYNEEYLARLYEYQVKKIIKIQSILRGFLTKCRMKKNNYKNKSQTKGGISGENNDLELTEEEAAQVIQKAYRRRAKKDQNDQGPKMNYEELKFIRPYAMRWKKSSFLQLLMKMKSKKIFDTFNLSIQVFLYNQKAYYDLKYQRDNVNESDIDVRATKVPWDGKPNPLVMKINYQWNEIPFYDTSNMLPGKTSLRLFEENEDSWDKPYKWKNQGDIEHQTSIDEICESNDQLINLTFSRNPDVKLKELKGEKFPEPIKPSPSPRMMKKTSEDKNKLKNSPDEMTYKQFKSPKKEVVKLKPAEPRKQYDNTQPANKDFDYIKAPVLKTKNPDPIAELKIMGRKNSASDDSPPFNFQGMLRKTNYKRESMKTIVNVRRFSIKSQDKDNNNKTNGITDFKNDHISFELGPELLLEGTVYDL